MSKAADLVEQAVHETLTYYAFPDIHWQKIRTNNPLERIMREIRRRTRVVGAFPDGQSCLNLAAARLRYIAGTAWSTKRYMNMRPLYQPQLMKPEPSPDQMCERFWTLPTSAMRRLRPKSCGDATCRSGPGPDLCTAADCSSIRSLRWRTRAGGLGAGLGRTIHAFIK